MLTDYIDCWDEMSPSDKFEAEQIFGDLLKDLKEVGCTLYQAKMYSKYSMTSTQSTVSLKTLVFCASAEIWSGSFASLSIACMRVHEFSLNTAVLIPLQPALNFLKCRADLFRNLVERDTLATPLSG